MRQKWYMATLKPSEIYFTQSSISSTFGRSTQHNRKKIGETLDDLVKGHCSVQSIPRIGVLKEGGKWWTADNRRLWIFRHLEKLGKCTTIPVNIIYCIDSRKRTTNNGGTDIRIYRGNDPGGYWHKQVSSIAIPIRPAQSTTETSENTKASATSINIHETKTSTANFENHTDISSVKTITRDIPEDKPVVNRLSANIVDKVNRNGANYRKWKDSNRLTSIKMRYCKQNSFAVGSSLRKSCVWKPLQWKRQHSLLYDFINWCRNEETEYSTKKTYYSSTFSNHAEKYGNLGVCETEESNPCENSEMETDDENEAFSTEGTYCSELTDQADNWETETDDQTTNESDDEEENIDESDDEDWRCYDLTYRKDGYVFNEYELGYDGDDQYMGSIDDDHYTAVLDRVYLDGHYDSDTDNDILVSDYI